MPDFRRNGVLMAKHGIYDLRHHLEEVVWPVLRKWRIFERDDFTGDGEQIRERLGLLIEELEKDVRQVRGAKRDRLLAREAQEAAEKQAS